MSDEKQETMADIVREMRNYAKQCREENFGVAPECEAHYNEDDVEYLADRIEAAWKRERAKVEAARHKPVDNAMMRKAILAIKDINDRRPHDADGYEINDIINDMLSEPEPTVEKSSAVGNAAAMREALETMNNLFERGVNCTSYANSAEEMEQIEELYRKAKSALSAPARNCDRFADELDAQLAFLNEVWLISVDRETMLARDKYENWSDEMRTRYGKWLLAPAAERKGEGDYA